MPESREADGIRLRKETKSQNMEKEAGVLGGRAKLARGGYGDLKGSGSRGSQVIQTVFHLPPCALSR